MRRSLVAVHTLLAIDDGRFVSLLDPPCGAAEAARGCRSEGTHPVLVGDGNTDVVLSSPIILYDHPAIAGESEGDLFDATEIDEILTLRILTLTDEEKQELRKGDERGRMILERAEALTPDEMMRLHGTVRSMRPVAGEGLPSTTGQQFPWEPAP
jgi:hypothetical protein